MTPLHDHGQTCGHPQAWLSTAGWLCTKRIGEKQDCPGGKLLEAEPIPWCDEHGSEMLEHYEIKDEYDECWQQIWTDIAVGFCRLEDPPTHWTIKP